MKSSQRLILAVLMVLVASVALAQTAPAPTTPKPAPTYGYILQFRVVNEVGWVLPTNSQYATAAALYRLDASGNREPNAIAYTNCWSDDPDGPWQDGCIMDGGVGNFLRDFNHNPLQAGNYELSVKANYHVVARVKLSLPSGLIEVNPEFVPAFGYDLGDNVMPTVPTEGGVLAKRIGLWNFKSKDGIVGAQVFVSGPSRTTDNTYYVLPPVNLPLPEAGSHSEPTIEVPIEGDRPNGWYCVTVRFAQKDRPEDEYNILGFCGLKGPQMMMLSTAEKEVKK